jgi:hypothetical protein
VDLAGLFVIRPMTALAICSAILCFPKGIACLESIVDFYAVVAFRHGFGGRVRAMMGEVLQLVQCTVRFLFRVSRMPC